MEPDVLPQEPDAEPEQKRSPLKGRRAGEVEAFYRAINRRSLSGCRFMALTRLLHYTGMRVGEALALDMRDLVWECGYADIRASKTPSGVRHALFPTNPERYAELERDMQRWLARRAETGTRSNRVFVSNNGNPLLYQSVDRTFRRVSERAGLDYELHAHQLRHTYATTLLENGATPAAVAKQLGHSSPAITMRTYSHVVDRSQVEAVGKF